MNIEDTLSERELFTVYTLQHKYTAIKKLLKKLDNYKDDVYLYVELLHNSQYTTPEQLDELIKLLNYMNDAGFAFSAGHFIKYKDIVLKLNKKFMIKICETRFENISYHGLYQSILNLKNIPTKDYNLSFAEIFSIIGDYNFIEELICGRRLNNKDVLRIFNHYHNKYGYNYVLVGFIDSFIDYYCEIPKSKYSEKKKELYRRLSGSVFRLIYRAGYTIK